MHGTRAAAAILFVSLSYWPHVSPGAEDADSGQLTGPHLGVLFDPSLRQFQQIYGIPGSATLGSPMDLGVSVSRALVSPDGDHALVELREGHEIGLIRFRDGRASTTLLANAPGAPDLMALSPSGSAGALLYVTTGRIVVLSNLGMAHAQAREVAFPFGLARPGLLAVSDDGAALLAVVSDGDENSLYTAAGDDLRLLGRFGRITSATFVAGTRRALVADALVNRIYRINAADAGAQLTPLADERQGISGPVAVAASGDATRVIVVNAAPQGIVVLDEGRGDWSVVPCNCVPTRLQTLRGGESFLLTADPATPMWLLNTEASSPRTLFVPAYREALGRTRDDRIRAPIGDGRARR